MPAGDQPFRVEPAVRLAVIGEAGHVPVTDEGRVDVPHGRTTANEDDALAKPRQDLLGPHGGADLEYRALLGSELRDRGDGDRAGGDDMAARQLEETRDVHPVFPAGITLPGQ